MKNKNRNLFISLIAVATIFVLAAIAYGGQYLTGRLFKLDTRQTSQSIEMSQQIPTALFITRGQIAEMLVQEIGVNPDPAVYNNCANDISGHPSEAAVCYLINEGYMEPFPDTDFRPDSYINRAEAAKLFVLVFDLPVPSIYSDIDKNQWWECTFYASST